MWARGNFWPTHSSGAQKSQNAAGLASSGEIAEMAHHRGHAALVALCESQHEVQLLLLLIALGDIGFAPPVMTARDVLGEVHRGAAVNPELFERLVKIVLGHVRTALDGGLLLRLGSELVENALQHRGVRVVALEEEIVGAAIGVGVHEDGAARLPIRGPRGRSPGSRLPDC